MSQVIDGRSGHPKRVNPRVVTTWYSHEELMIEIRSEMADTGDRANAHILLDAGGRRALIEALGGTP